MIGVSPVAAKVWLYADPTTYLECVLCLRRSYASVPLKSAFSSAKSSAVKPLGPIPRAKCLGIRALCVRYTKNHLSPLCPLCVPFMHRRYHIWLYFTGGERWQKPAVSAGFCIWLDFFWVLLGGDVEIRTLGALQLRRSPGACLRPLGHISAKTECIIHESIFSGKACHINRLDTYSHR